MCKYKILINHLMVNSTLVCYSKYLLKVGISICIKNKFDTSIFTTQNTLYVMQNYSDHLTLVFPLSPKDQHIARHNSAIQTKWYMVFISLFHD